MPAIQGTENEKGLEEALCYTTDSISLSFR